MQVQTQKLHLIEPTLFDQTGHGFSYTSSLVQANSYLDNDSTMKFDISLWIDKRGRELFKSEVDKCEDSKDNRNNKLKADNWDNQNKRCPPIERARHIVFEPSKKHA